MNNYQFTYKVNDKDLMTKDYKVSANTALEAIEAFDKDRPGCVFIAMWDNTKL